MPSNSSPHHPKQQPKGKDPFTPCEDEKPLSAPYWREKKCQSFCSHYVAESDCPAFGRGVLYMRTLSKHCSQPEGNFAPRVFFSEPNLLTGQRLDKQGIQWCQRHRHGFGGLTWECTPNKELEQADIGEMIIPQHLLLLELLNLCFNTISVHMSPFADAQLLYCVIIHIFRDLKKKTFVFPQKSKSGF